MKSKRQLSLIADRKRYLLHTHTPAPGLSQLIPTRDTPSAAHLSSSSRPSTCPDCSHSTDLTLTSKSRRTSCKEATQSNQIAQTRVQLVVSTRLRVYAVFGWFLAAKSEQIGPTFKHSRQPVTVSFGTRWDNDKAHNSCSKGGAASKVSALSFTETTAQLMHVHG
uniref:Uncharacterized protein n=1 Tax=Peronospora matthiolae TaxID=2874970 RepID=A0AAV1THQ1_9STRA